MAFLKSLREVLAIGPSKRRSPDTPWKGTPADKLTFIQNVEQITEIRESLKKGKIEDER